MNAKTLEHPRPCSVLGSSGGGGRGGGAAHYPRTGVSMVGGGPYFPISDLIRLAGMQILIWWEVYLLIIN